MNLPRGSAVTIKPDVKSLAEIPRGVFTGFAQILLQPSPLTGAAFIAGAFWNSYVIASFGVLGCFAGVLTAIIRGYPKDERHDGLYGFNGALVGLGMSYFYEASPLLGVLVVAGGVASSVVMHRMLRLNMHPLTLPFVAVTWLIMVLSWATGWLGGAAGTGPGQSEIAALDALSRGIGQVLFQENIITGIVFLAAIAMRDWMQGIYMLLATALGLGFAYVAGFPVDAINLGLFGYNGVLCGILFAGQTLKDLLSAMAAIVLSIMVVRLAHRLDIVALTFPFVLSSWLVLWARGKAARQIRA